MYDKKTARKLIDTYRTYGKPVRHGEIARKLNMAKATFSRRLNPSPKYRGLGFTEDDILKMAEFLNIPDADRSTLLQCYGHASRHDRRQANTQSDTLPVPPVPFIGRVKELAEARELLSQTRVLTVTGVGGGGKTRFVIALARAIQLEKLREVGFVDLAPIENGADVPQAVARALHVEAPEELVLERVGEYLQSRRFLLVLDNCEHLRGACAELITRLLLHCPDLAVMVASRQDLGLGPHLETIYALPPLSLPDLGALTDGHVAIQAEVERSDALKFFLAVAKRRKHDFTLSSRNAEAVFQLCHRLEGIPLALRLAAAQVHTRSSVKEIHQQIRSLRLPQDELPELRAQHRSFVLAMDWSHKFLSTKEQIVFRRLAVFAGTFGHDAARAVCADDSGCAHPARSPLRSGEAPADAATPAGVSQEEVSDILDGLVSKAMVLSVDGTDISDEQSHYRLLQPIREYAAEKLQMANEYHLMRERHLCFYVRLATENEPKLTGPEREVWIKRIVAEINDIRLALTWSTDPKRTTLGINDAGEAACQLAGFIGWAWYFTGYLDEGRRWLRRALEAAEEKSVPTLAKAEALHAAGNLAVNQGDYKEAHSYLTRHLLLRQQLSHQVGLAYALTFLARAKQFLGRYDEAYQLYTQALTTFEELGNQWGVALTALCRCETQLAAGDIGGAKESVRIGWARFEEKGDVWGRAVSLLFAGRLALHATSYTDYEQARSNLTEAVHVFQEMGDRWVIIRSYNALAELARCQNNLAAAKQWYRQSLILCRQLADKGGTAACFAGIAGIATAERKYSRAARLMGATEALYGVIGGPMPATEKSRYDQDVAAVRAALGETAYEVAWAQGDEMIPRPAHEDGTVIYPERAVAYALDDDEIAGSDCYPAFVGRQRELALLMARLEAAYQGRGAFLLLTGEPGIGKTCLAEEFASAAEKRGAHVVWGRCSEREGAPELWPWVQVLRTCIRALDTGNPRSMTGKGVLVDIAQVVPELREFLPELPAPPALDPTSVRFRLSDSVTTFLKNVGTPRQPLVVILDDLHWADRPSLQLLEELARSLPGGRSYLLLVGIYRDTEVGHEHPLTRTSKRAAEPPIPLRGFSEPELTNFIALTSGLQLPEGLIKTIHERTGGNPFLASEIVRALPADGHLDRSGTLTASPDAEPRYWIKQRAPTYRVRKPTSALPPAKARFVQLRVEDFMSLGARSARAR